MRLSTDSTGFKEAVSFDETITPADRIEKVSFSTQITENKLLLGVGSKDTSVRVYSIEDSIFG